MSKVLISLSSRYSIYKVQFRPAAVRCELRYSITAYQICQELFSSFSNLFKPLLSSRCERRSSDNFDILSQNFLFVKRIFLVFQDFLFCHRRVPDDFDILPPVSLFVNHYFYIFSEISICLLASANANFFHICPPVADALILRRTGNIKG